MLDIRYLQNFLSDLDEKMFGKLFQIRQIERKIKKKGFNCNDIFLIRLCRWRPSVSKFSMYKRGAWRMEI